MFACVWHKPQEDLVDYAASVLGGKNIGREVVHQREHRRDRQPIFDYARCDWCSRGGWIIHRASMITKRQRRTGRNEKGKSELPLLPFGRLFCPWRLALECLRAGHDFDDLACD